MNLPVIGLTTYGVAQAEGYYIPGEYVDAVCRAGGVPLLLPPVPAPPVDIVSWNHQAVDRLGKGLRPVAWSADGLVEAVELADHPNLLAVQWHPELSAAEDPTQQALFDRLTELAQEAGRK